MQKSRAVCKISWNVLQRAVTVPGTDSWLFQLCVAAWSLVFWCGTREKKSLLALPGEPENVKNKLLS